MSEADNKAFERLRVEVKAAVDAGLASFLDARANDVRDLGADLAATLDATRALALRGGKRLRPVLLAAAYEACGGAGGAKAVTMAGVALELLQTYLLIHDDWMDDDDTRRGGPSVHAALRERFGDRRAGDSVAVIAGDAACAMAQEALLEVDAPAQRLVGAARELAGVQLAVCFGQLLDVRAWADSPSDVETVHGLKTSSYTVTGPVRIGAILAGANDRALDALTRFAGPLGVAFQLRDDLLGTFGDPRVTGKSAGSDLRQGKRTALVAEVARDPEAKRLLPRVLGVDDASADEVNALVKRMNESGARARVEARVVALRDEALEALASSGIAEAALAALRGAALALSERER
jgi:geranylgeranyl diphosphate synthase type I